MTTSMLPVRYSSFYIDDSIDTHHADFAELARHLTVAAGEDEEEEDGDSGSESDSDSNV